MAVKSQPRQVESASKKGTLLGGAVEAEEKGVGREAEGAEVITVVLHVCAEAERAVKPVMPAAGAAERGRAGLLILTRP